MKDRDALCPYQVWSLASFSFTPLFSSSLGLAVSPSAGTCFTSFHSSAGSCSHWSPDRGQSLCREHLLNVCACGSVCSLYLAPRPSVLVLESMKVGYIIGENQLVTKVSIPVTALAGWQVNEHLSSLSPHPCSPQTLSFPLIMGCAISRTTGGWKQRKKGEQIRGSRGCVCGRERWDQRQNDITLPGRNKYWKGMGRGEVPLFCRAVTVVLCLPRDCTVMRVSESSHISLATETLRWLAWWWVALSKWRRWSPHTQNTQSCVDAATVDEQ